jgi:hypothetical protein
LALLPLWAIYPKKSKAASPGIRKRCQPLEPPGPIALESLCGESDLAVATAGTPRTCAEAPAIEQPDVDVPEALDPVIRVVARDTIFVVKECIRIEGVDLIRLVSNARRGERREIG